MQEVVARMAEIQKQIKELVSEGVTLADQNGLTFNLSDTEFAAEYGMGGYRYVPEDGTEAQERAKTEWYSDYQISGWLTSSSECD
jgi:hypothetical protein